MGFGCHELLDDAVFQRVKADHHQSPVLRHLPKRFLQSYFEFFKLLIDENPYSLKCTSGRVFAFLAGFDGLCHERGKLSCA